MVPSVPGAYSVFEGSAIDDGERISRRVLTTVTYLSTIKTLRSGGRRADQVSGSAGLVPPPASGEGEMLGLLVHGGGPRSTKTARVR